jgi:hypothetical protein
LPKNPVLHCRSTLRGACSSINGGVLDFHGTGANPAATAALTDAAFVAGRFRVVQNRRHV